MSAEYILVGMRAPPRSYSTVLRVRLKDIFAFSAARVTNPRNPNSVHFSISCVTRRYAIPKCILVELS